MSLNVKTLAEETAKLIDSVTPESQDSTQAIETFRENCGISETPSDVETKD